MARHTPGCAHEHLQVDLFQRGQDHRHALGMDRRDYGWPRSSGVKRLMRALDGRALWIRRALPERAQRLIKAKSGRSSLEANRLLVFRGFVSAYSQNDFARRCSEFPESGRQCDLRRCGPSLLAGRRSRRPSVRARTSSRRECRRSVPSAVREYAGRSSRLAVRFALSLAGVAMFLARGTCTTPAIQRLLAGP